MIFSIFRHMPPPMLLQRHDAYDAAAGAISIFISPRHCLRHFAAMPPMPFR